MTHAYITPANKRDGAVYHTNQGCPNLPADARAIDADTVADAWDECKRCSGEWASQGGSSDLYEAIKP